MTYCLAIAVNEGIIFASDSRTNAGVDQVSHYGKMFTFSRDGDRQLVLLSAGNLATTQAVIDLIKRDLKESSETNFYSVETMSDAADYLGDIIRNTQEKYGEAVTQAGFSAEVTFILGGQIGHAEPRMFLIYPQGNYISSSEQTPYLQIGEAKYGRPVLDRIITRDTGLDEAARCAVVSIDSTMRSNVSVGPPIEVLSYEAGSLRLGRYRCLEADDAYLIEIRRQWNQKLLEAFVELPDITWTEVPQKPRFE